jgi:hypothetical protein
VHVREREMYSDRDGCMCVKVKCTRIETGACA